MGKMFYAQRLPTVIMIRLDESSTFANLLVVQVSPAPRGYLRSPIGVQAPLRSYVHRLGLRVLSRRGGEVFEGRR